LIEVLPEEMLAYRDDCGRPRHAGTHTLTRS
jgi:hypothetical protein